MSYGQKTDHYIDHYKVPVQASHHTIELTGRRCYSKHTHHAMCSSVQTSMRLLDKIHQAIIYDNLYLL